MWRQDRKNNLVSQTVENKAESKRSLSVANECFDRWNEEFTILASKSTLSPKEERRLTQLSQLVSGSERYECFFPVHKMPIYQELLEEIFIRSAKEHTDNTKPKTNNQIRRNIKC